MDIKGKKRKEVIGLCFLSMVCCTACGIFEERKSSTELIEDFVLEYHEEIRERIEEVDEERLNELRGCKGVPGLGEFVDISDLRVYDEEQQKYLDKGFVYFECEAYGLSTCSVISGFYYSPEDIHSKQISWAGGDDWIEVPCEEENTWYYMETVESDNTLETSKICDNFYYFQIRN